MNYIFSAALGQLYFGVQQSVWRFFCVQLCVCECFCVQETAGVPPGWRIPPPGESEPAVPPATPSAPRARSAVGWNSPTRLPIGRGARPPSPSQPAAATRRPSSPRSRARAAIGWGRPGGRAERGAGGGGCLTRGRWRARRAETERRGWTALEGRDREHSQCNKINNS